MDCRIPDCEPIGCARHICVKNNQKVLIYSSKLRFFGHFRLDLPSLAEYFHSLIRGNDDCLFIPTSRLLEVVIPTYDCMEAGGSATQDAKAEAGIHLKNTPKTLNCLPQ